MKLFRSRTDARRILPVGPFAFVLVGLYCGSYLLLVEIGREPGWPQAFRYSPDSRANRVLSCVFSPAYEIDNRVRGTIWCPHGPMKDLADSLFRETLDPEELFSIEYSDVPFADALHGMPGVFAEALRGRVSNELAVQGKLGEEPVTLMQFRIASDQLQSSADAFGMLRMTELESRLTLPRVRYEFRRQAESAPAWFNKWRDAEPLVAGITYGATYELFLLGTQGDDGEVVVFAEAASWPESSGDAPCVYGDIVWRDPEPPALSAPEAEDR